MQGTSLLGPCGLVVGTAYLSTHYHTSFAIDRPVHTSIVLLLLCGLTIICTARLRIGVNRESSPLKAREGNAPFQGPQSPRLSFSIGPYRLGVSVIWNWRTLLALLLVLAICTRVSIVYRVLKDVQCARHSSLGLLPFILALFDALFIPRNRDAGLDTQKRFTSESGLKTLFIRELNGRSCCIIATLLMGWSSYAIASYNSLLPTSYICSQSQSTQAIIPILQGFGFLIDSVSIVLIGYLLEDCEGKDRDHANETVIGYAFIAASFILSIAGVTIYLAMPEHRHWIISLPSHYTNGVTKLSLLVIGITFCFIRTVRNVGLLNASILVLFAVTYTTTARALWIHYSYGYPPTPSTKLSLCSILSLASLLMYISSLPKADGKRRPALWPKSGRFHSLSLVYPLFAILLIGCIIPTSWGPAAVDVHPIDSLVTAASSKHQKWARQAGSSTSLAEATYMYQTRYKRRPPPGFDQWYHYASERSSAVIDDFDNVYEDLEPFWSLSPSEIRDRTIDILSKPSNDLGGISIRNGKAEVFSNVPGTHRWMLDGAVAMMENFASWLPDMDIAINLNDECRVAVSFDDLRKGIEAKRRNIRNSYGSTAPSTIPGFSQNRSATWKALPEEPLTTSSFIGSGFNPTYHSFGSISCRPDSPARTVRHWDTSYLCTTCSAPHASGLFVSDWSLSASPCHQPDIANLHGLHLSPAAFVGTHKLMPIFSQSKAPGYADIRFPSPWNYMDKAVYSPSPEYPDLPFREKAEILFWRGATSEGVSAGGGAWKGMLRQRLVHLLNNSTTPQLALLNSTSHHYNHELVEPTTLKQNLGTTVDVRFVSPIVRCGGVDCPTQATEFGFGNSVDFQQHWRYRYLFDADGAGFSGRFLPFLQSHSLVFKTALFREWYEGRLEAWAHFVPVDLRLHDLWSLLAYFGGYGGKQEGGMAARIEVGEKIAEEGREWVGKVLRKEDMEIYFFRLLLEWGRLTDERRDEIGLGE